MVTNSYLVTVMPISLVLPTWYSMHLSKPSKASPFSTCSQSLHVIHLWTLVVSSAVGHPPNPNQNRQPNSNHAGIVHSICGRGQTVREAVDHERNHNIETSNRVDGRSKFPQPERPRLNILAARKKMGENRQKIRQSRHQDKRADESIKGCQGPNIDRTRASQEDAAGESGPQWTPPAGTDSPDITGEWSGVVTAQRVDGSSCCDIAADGCAEDRTDGQSEETHCSGSRPGSLEVDIPEWADRICVHYFRQIVDGVEHCNEVAEAGDEADDDLAAQRDGDVLRCPIWLSVNIE